MTDIHRFVAYSIPTGFVILALWAAVSLVRNRNPHDLFWSLLAALQIIIGVQVLVGGYLYITGARPETNGPEWLHYVYGGLFPAGVLIAAHRVAAAERFKSIPWAVFGFAALICFGLTFRALQTGLGID